MTRLERARAFRARLNVAMAGLAQAGTVENDVIACVAERFGPDGTQYRRGEMRVGADGALYRCAQDTNKGEHAAGAWVRMDRVENVGGVAYPAWVKPEKKAAAYRKGDVVAHEGAVYECTENGNMWEPSSGAGWIVKEEGEAEDER